MAWVYAICPPQSRSVHRACTHVIRPSWSQSTHHISTDRVQIQVHKMPRVRASTRMLYTQAIYSSPRAHHIWSNRIHTHWPSRSRTLTYLAWMHTSCLAQNPSAHRTPPNQIPVHKLSTILLDMFMTYCLPESRASIPLSRISVKLNSNRMSLLHPHKSPHATCVTLITLTVVHASKPLRVAHHGGSTKWHLYTCDQCLAPSVRIPDIGNLRTF